MIEERIHAGLQTAKKQGKQLGPPEVDQNTERAIKAARTTGNGINKIARELGVESSTVRFVISES